METVKHHFAVATSIDPFADPVRHQAAALLAGIEVARMVEAVRAEPGNETLPYRPTYNYIVNRAYADLTGPIATERERQEAYLPVYFAPGRPRRPLSRRQKLVEEIRVRPDMASYLIKDRAISLGIWNGLSDEPRNVTRRISKLRRDAGL